MKATRETNGNWVWFIGSWLVWNFLVGVVRFLWGCLVFLLAFVSLVAFMVWVLTL